MTCDEGGRGGARLQSAREALGWESVPPLEVHHGRVHCGQFAVFVHLQDVEESQSLLVVPGSHRSEFERPQGCVPNSCVRVGPICAGDVVLIPEALTRGAVRGKQVLEFRYGFQYSGAAPAELPATVSERLSDDTKMLMGYAHVLHTKPMANEWVETFYPRL